MATEIVPATDFYKLTESIDEKQIMDIDEFKDILCYKDGKSGKYELSYKGIKHLVLEMAAKGFPLITIEDKYELLGDGVEKTWYADVKIKNGTTGLVHDGHSEAPYYENDGKNPATFKEPLIKDPFARTKALSKAKRNASKQHLPEAMIIHLVNRATTQGQVKELKVNNSQEVNKCSCPTDIKLRLPVQNGKCPNCGKLR